MQRDKIRKMSLELEIKTIQVFAKIQEILNDQDAVNILTNHVTDVLQQTGEITDSIQVSEDEIQKIFEENAPKTSMLVFS